MGTLFATTVANARPQDKDYKLSDGGGLYLLVRTNGAKLWRLNYRYLEKYRTLALGDWGKVRWSLGFNYNKAKITKVADTPAQLAADNLTLFDRVARGYTPLRSRRH